MSVTGEVSSYLPNLEAVDYCFRLPVLTAPGRVPVLVQTMGNLVNRWEPDRRPDAIADRVCHGRALVLFTTVFASF